MSKPAFFAFLGAFLINGTLFLTPASGVPDPPTWVIGVIPQKSTLHKALAAKGMSSRQIYRITPLLSPHIDLRKIRNDSAFRFSLDRDGELREFLLDLDGRTICRLARDAQGRFTVSKRPWKRRLEQSTISGAVSTSLEHALKQAGEAGELALLFRQILSEQVGLCTEMEKVDRFKLIVEKIYAEDKIIRYGEIRSFVVRSGNTTVRAFRHKGIYYDENGISLRSQFLRLPLDYHYVSSEFMKSRKHPILGGVRPHSGIDFAASIGTPVWAVADGEIVSYGWRGGYGFAVQIRHAHGYETLYGHLNRIAQGIRGGAKVQQRQVIGYIGASGLSTGPHLHYGLTKYGKNCNPLLEQFPRETITEAGDRKDFLEKKRTMLALLGEGG